VEEKKETIHILRFEQDLFNQSTADLGLGIRAVKAKYGKFFDDFTLGILGFPNSDSIEFKQTLLSFIQDPDMKDVNKEIQKRFANISFLEEDLAGAFSYYKHYYPDSILPKVLTMNSGFNYAVVTTDSVLAIGLDMYLGDSCRYYTLLGLPKYKTRTMNRNFVATDVVKGWTSTIFEEPKQTSGSLLAKMIYQGKMLYLLDALMPEKEDSIKINYSKLQINWCIENEVKTWQAIINKKLLFSTKNEEIIKLMNEAPFSAGFPRESPGRLGQWIGWQIVRKYMKNHPQTTLQALMNEQDYEKIFRESKYKPK
jgi:hypothetical protein